VKSLSEVVSSRSPWALATAHKEAVVTPATGPISGEIYVSGSKSYTNRALIIAALAEGRSTLTGILKSDDSYWCIDALKRLGTSIEVDEEQSRVVIQGSHGNWKNKEGDLFIGAAGTIARFIPGALAVSAEGSWKVDGIPQLRERPLEPLINALRELGGQIDYLSQNKGLPLQVKGTSLRGGNVSIPGDVSSQFLSGLLIASPYAQEPVSIEVTKGLVQPSYIGITVQLMRQFGAKINHTDDYRQLTVESKGYQGQEAVLEADASTACYFLTLAALTGGTIRVKNVGYHSYQPDARFIDVLEQMGCQVIKDASYLEVTGPEQLRGGFEVDMKPMSDQALTIGALAPFADKPITVTNVAHIRSHESDRISVICNSLKKMGVQVEEREDGFTISPGQPLGTTLDPHDDHRNAMVFGLLGVKVPGIRILNPGCVSKTCPTYFTELQKLGLKVQLD
jgi:3-phosphoshikimate 1-carboxyvinyltransferase